MLEGGEVNAVPFADNQFLVNREIFQSPWTSRKTVFCIGKLSERTVMPLARHKQAP